jgi:signal transduction histidine kinase
MRVLLPRTITARIVLGFFVLLGTVGTVSAYTIVKMRQLGRELRFIRTTYLDTLKDVAQLQSWQVAITDYLDGASVLRPSVRNNFEARRKLLREIAAQLGNLREVPDEHSDFVNKTMSRAKALLGDFGVNEGLYEVAFEASALSEEQKAALGRVRKNEGLLKGNITSWFRELEGDVLRSTAKLERAEHNARLWAMALGSLAAVIALAIIIGAVLTLRPLRRLADSVRKVGRGDYRQRIDVGGGTEVAEVAREFNAMAQAIEERELDLVRSERLAAVGKMAAVITHEVRNPLSSIGLNTELLEEELKKMSGASAEHGEAVLLCHAIQKEVDRLTAITEEYLRFARLPRPKLEREQVNAIVSGLVEFQREELSLSGVDVKARLEPDLPLVAADESQLRQALLNLLRNAADAMTGAGASGRPRSLTVATRRAPGGAVEVLVEDTGPGIDKELLSKIFEPFFSTKEGGTGLGLALTQQIIAEHGGRIDVESTVGRGTIFVVSLPVSA